VAHRKPPHRHPIHSFQKPKEGDLSEPEEAASPRGDFIPEWWAISSRNGGRFQIGMAGDFISESWAISSGISITTTSETAGNYIEPMGPGEMFPFGDIVVEDWSHGLQFAQFTFSSPP
jgi:hypothetical protein